MNLDKKRLIVIGFMAVLGLLALFLDEQIISLFKSIENPVLNDIFSLFRPVSAMVLVAGLMLVFLLIEHKRKLVIPFGLTLIISTLVSFIIKFIAMRPRPEGIIKNIWLTPFIDFSFPSSHAVFIFSAIPILNKEFPKLRWAWIGLASLIALSRVYFRVHYASDVIFGAIIGYLIGLYGVKIEQKYLNKKKKL